MAAALDTEAGARYRVNVREQKFTHVDKPEAVGARLREARQRRGLSQRALSFRGCSHAYISRIEAGERTPSLQLLGELARRVGVSEEYLAWGRAGPARRDRLMEAEIALRLDDVEQAQRRFDEALRAAESSAERGEALAGLGQVAWRRGDVTATIDYLERALELLGDRWADHPNLGDTLGRAYTTVPEMERSIMLFERYLEAANERRDVVNSLRFSVLLANALVDSGNLGRATELLAHMLSQVEGDGDALLLARVYWTQARLHEQAGEHETAARSARRALDLLEATEHREYLGRAHQLLAYIELECERPDEALRLARRSRELMNPAATDLELVRTTAIEAGALAQLGDHEVAAGLAMEAAGLLTRTHPANAGQNYALLAYIFDQLGDRARALELYELAVEVLEPHWNAFLPRVCARYAALLEQEGRTEDAFEVLKKAVSWQATRTAGA
jgi:tetratricopeptide (TPR) repeat protein